MDKLVSSGSCKMPTEGSLNDLLFEVRFYSDTLGLCSLLLNFKLLLSWNVKMKNQAVEIIITVILKSICFKYFLSLKIIQHLK